MPRVALTFATAILFNIFPIEGGSSMIPLSLIALADDSSTVASNSNSPSTSVGKSVTLPSGVQYYDAVDISSLHYMQ